MEELAEFESIFEKNDDMVNVMYNRLPYISGRIFEDNDKTFK